MLIRIKKIITIYLTLWIPYACLYSHTLGIDEVFINLLAVNLSEQSGSVAFSFYRLKTNK